jgi:hypothetical protein
MELQDSRFLKILGENASLKAGMDLLLADPTSGERCTLQGAEVWRLAL